MKSIITSILIFLSFNAFTQSDTTIITSRDEIPLQAVLAIDSYKQLYVGQKYTFVITTSGDYKLKVNAKNAHVELVESSKRGTGGLLYLVTPLTTGTCSINIFNVINDERTVSLSSHNYGVIPYPTPPLHIVGLKTGQIINELADSTVIQCSYSKDSGVFDNYEIKSWTVVIGDITFSGNGYLLSEELIKYINKVEHDFMHISVQLNENKTGHFSSEAVYLIRKGL